MDADRRRRFLDYFERELKSDRARLISKSKLTKGRIAQLFDERQPFGERAARSLADRLGLDPDHFEHDKYGAVGMGVDPLAAILLAEFGTDEHQRTAMATRLRRLADQISTSNDLPIPPIADSPTTGGTRAPRKR